MSPYAQSLEQDIRLAGSEIDRAKAEVLLACYWVRVGELDAAEAIRQRTRQAFPSGQYGDLTVLHMCLDGLFHYYSNQSPAAIDRIKPAHALATTYRFRKEQAFSAAWLAHIEFNRDQWGATLAALSSCRAALDRTDKGTEGRMSLVVADALLHAGQEQHSKKWYSHAHALFTSIGDHAAIEAFLYNRAALRLHATRIGAITQPVDEAQVKLLGGEIASATNYQRLARLRSLDYLLDIASASHKILCGDFGSAKSLLRELLAESAIATYSRAVPLVLADLAMCEAVCGEHSEAQSTMESAEKAARLDLSQDDIALIAHSLFTAGAAMNMADAADRWKRERDTALADFTRTREDLSGRFGEWMVEPLKALSAVP
jgi:tetratricopeptide (TPR) repeat protein